MVSPLAAVSDSKAKGNGDAVGVGTAGLERRVLDGPDRQTAGGFGSGTGTHVGSFNDSHRRRSVRSAEPGSARGAGMSS